MVLLVFRLGYVDLKQKIIVVCCIVVVPSKRYSRRKRITTTDELLHIESSDKAVCIVQVVKANPNP